MRTLSFASLLLVAQLALCQEPTTKNESTQKTIRLKDLPEPPKEIARLIDSGEVTFATGGEPQLDARGFPSGINIVGETRFDSKYHYNSNAQWNVNGSSVEIKVRFRSLRLVTKHVVWLKEVPGPEAFWTDRVVLHEFDHVRISTDKRIESQFFKEVRKLSSFVVPASRVVTNGRVDNAKIQRAIRERVKESFERISDYVRIRYRELDRVTRHGLLPIPQNFDEEASASSTNVGR
ncbi:MAG: hypothetical protein AAFX06_20895 [Planctomycetota bacterium]